MTTSAEHVNNLKSQQQVLSSFLEREYGSYIGRTIKEIRPMTQQEVDHMYWDLGYSDVPFVILFDDGQAWIPSRDPEANGPGFLLNADVQTLSFR